MGAAEDALQTRLMKERIRKDKAEQHRLAAIEDDQIQHSYLSADRPRALVSDPQARPRTLDGYLSAANRPRQVMRPLNGRPAKPLLGMRADGNTSDDNESLRSDEEKENNPKVSRFRIYSRENTSSEQ